MKPNVSIDSKYETVIGLEVHAQLSTNTKIFCGCSTGFGAEPNSQTCPVCLGMPGVLPVLNKKVVESAIKMGLATNSQIRLLNTFARKNYFYPDLPKGYQVSQFDEPICEHGTVEIEVDGTKRVVRITRIHMEEDAGKSVHSEEYVADDETMIDLNRCGVPLIEIVSEPDIRSAKEASAYLVKLRQLVRYLGICDGNMEEGSLRCDANISIRPRGQKTLGVRTELKNMNSFHNVERALEYEIKRQIKLVESAGQVVQETLLWDPQKNEARSMRGKEESHDYRYFPEPDLVPVVIKAGWLADIQKTMPELPDEKYARFVSELKLSAYNASVLTAARDIADYFEQTAEQCGDKRLVSNWVMGEVMRALNEQKIEISDFAIEPKRLADLLNFISNKTINASAAKKVFDKMLTTSSSAADLIEQMGLRQVSDSAEIEKIVDEILAANPAEVEAYKNGKTKVVGFLVGQIMRQSKGKANPAIVNELLKNKLG